MVEKQLAARRVDLGKRLVPYQEGWDLQRQVHEEVVGRETPPTLLFLEHQATFTAGKRTQPEDRPADGVEVIEVDRGGRITWHGPGQLVCYPIVPLGQPFDVVAHVRRLETAIMRTCADYDISTEQVAGRSGVWCASTNPACKIAAIGVRVARGVTMHGLALNVDCDLSWSQRIVPCGIPDASVTSMAQETGRDFNVSVVSDSLERHLREVLEPTLSANAA